MTTLIPIEHVGRDRRGLLLRRGASSGEASPLRGRSRESLDDVIRAITLGETPPPSLDFALWSLDATPSKAAVRSQVLLEDPRTAIREAQAAIALGHRAFKLKIRSVDDAELAASLRALGVEVRVDANRAFAHESAVPWDVLARAGVAWIEEPCPDAGSLTGTPIPIALDESVAENADRALEDVADGRVAALVLKPTILGATQTLRIASACRGRVIVSHAFESDVGRRAAEELAHRIAPNELHGLFPWAGIDAFRMVAGHAHVDSALG